MDLYCRVSEDYDGDGGLRSVEDQSFDGEEFIRTLGCCYRIGRVWMDPDLSGWNKKVIRPDFNACMARLSANEAQGLWVYDISRFSRKPEEGRHLIEAADRGIMLYSNNRERDLRRADDRKWFRDRLADAEFESMRMGERISRGKRIKAIRRGKPNTSTRGFGMPGPLPPPPKSEWRGERPAIVMADADLVAEEADAIRHCAEMVLVGRSSNEAVRYLNDNGFRTYYGNIWTPATFRIMMLRPSLAGYVTYNEEIVPDQELPRPWVLERPDWEAVRLTLTSRRRGPVAHQGLLVGVMRCGVCGRFVRKATRGNKYVGEKKWTYRCSGDQVGAVIKCGKVDMSLYIADEVVEAAVLRRLSDARHREELADISAAGLARRARIAAQIETARASGRDMARKLGLGLIDDAAHEEFAVANAERVARLTADSRAVELPQMPTVAAEAAVEQWEKAADNVPLRRQMVREAFPWLTVRPAVLRGRNAAQPERIDFLGESLPEGVKK